MHICDHQDLQLTLLDYVHDKHLKKAEKPAELIVAYEIPLALLTGPGN